MICGIAPSNTIKPQADKHADHHSTQWGQKAVANDTAANHSAAWRHVLLDHKPTVTDLSSIVQAILVGIFHYKKPNKCNL